MGWAGVSSGYDQLAKASHRAVMDWSCASNWAEGASVRASVRVVIPWSIWSSGVNTGVVMIW